MKNNIHDFRTDTDKVFGIYRGVVEERNDIEKLGRCRIRVLGIHDQLKDKNDTDGIPTEELPWAEPCYGLFQGSVSGNGNYSIPLQGSYVFVFFENGNLMQIRYFLSAPGIAELPPNGKEGFNDPKEEWPMEPWLDEPDLHRFMKRDKLGDTSLILVKEPSLDLGVAVAIGGEWDEWPPMYEAQYPYNNVIHSCDPKEGGEIYQEWDTTPGKERWHLYHHSNSYMEIGVKGTMTLRNNDHRYDITVRSKMEHTIEDHHRCVNKNRTSKVIENEYEQVDLNHYKDIGIMCRETVNVIRWHDVLISDLLYDPLTKGKEIGVEDYKYVGLFEQGYCGVYHIQWNNMLNDKYTQLIDREIVGLNKYKHIENDEVIKVKNTRHSWIEVEDKIECKDVLILRADGKIIIDAPEIQINGGGLAIQTEWTTVAGEFSWSGIAESAAMFAEIAVELGDLHENEWPIEPHVDTVEPIDQPKPVKPLDPPGPPAIPTPPPPPIPDEYDYSDKPPEPDICL